MHQHVGRYPSQDSVARSWRHNKNRSGDSSLIASRIGRNVTVNVVRELAHQPHSYPTSFGS